MTRDTHSVLVIGHRGASKAADENTVEAFALAAAMGADGVELDVRLSSDGRLVVKHDPLPVDPSSLATYPELAEVLKACGDMLVNVEIKNSVGDPDHDESLAIVEPAISEMRRHGDPERWIISSFDWRTVERCRQVAPDIATAYLVERLAADDIERTAAAGHAAIHPWERTVTSDVVERCHAVGLAVTTWTCNDPQRIEELAAMGVDGVCTDVPDTALVALGRRLGPIRASWGRPT